MLSILSKYTHWLHSQWPSGTVEKLPDVRDDGRTTVSGVRVVGDLTGIPLLKFSGDTGARAVRDLLAEPDFNPAQRNQEGILDLAIVGGGVSGIAAAIEAKKTGLSFRLFEAVEPFSTIKNFPKGKPIYTYPTEMKPAGELQFEANAKEPLIEELERQREDAGIVPEQVSIERIRRQSGILHLEHAGETPYRAQRVIVAIGRSGNYRKLGIAGEDLDKVSNRLHDPKDYAGQQVLVVGGGDSALETAISLAESQAAVTLSYRKKEFSRPKPDNIEKIQDFSREQAIDAEPTKGQIRVHLGSQVKNIGEKQVSLETASKNSLNIKNDHVFVMIGREAPLDFFRRSGIRIRGEWGMQAWISFIAFFAFTVLFYHWQKGLWFTQELDPKYLSEWITTVGGIFKEPSQTPGNFLHVLRSALDQPGFYYSFAYCLCVSIFGYKRIRRRKTPYIRLQTFTLAAFQILPLFLLPWLLLPWAGENGWWADGFGRVVADLFWPNGEYWRAFGLVLAWPLFIYNWFTDQPLWGWLILGGIQTFVVIPYIVRRWGKGAYCGWICSCGALAETLGDSHRHKMPHGPLWNRVNMIGQIILGLAIVIMVFRILGWIFPTTIFASLFQWLLSDMPFLNYKYFVDVWLAGILGVGFYFHFSGRVWCRFACPLAALMHIYARFSRFRIFSNKKKCISCNVCTSVCHQGIDIMSFANKGRPMKDPECVRCSACVQSCPTGVLTFGRYGDGDKVICDKLMASPVQMYESEHASKLLHEVDTRA